MPPNDRSAGFDPVPAPDAAPDRADRFRPLALAGLTVVLLALCVLLTVPFLPALAWGVALAIIAWPVHEWSAFRRAQRGLKDRRAAHLRDVTI